MTRRYPRIILVVAVALFSLGNRAFAAVGPSDDESADDDVSSRTAELSTDHALPENEVILYDELRKIEDELSRARRDLSSAQEDKDTARDLDAYRTKYASTIDTATRLDCKSKQVGADGAVAGVLRDLRTTLGSLERKSWDLDAQSDFPAGADQLFGKDAKPTCDTVVAFAQGEAKAQTVPKLIDEMKNQLAKRNQKRSARRGKLNSLLDALQKRRAAIQDKLSAKTSQQQISGYLWAMILVIGILSLGAIVAVKLFTPELQLEWVASGQVIQFVTVMVLLSVILALGLASIIKENTLGTLLGGIAGYVLAQGVGRAAAREVSRRQGAPPIHDA
jgi:hypothetical protein